MPKFATVAFKDMRVLMRDTAALGVLLGMPMILILILGSAFGGLAGDAGFDAKVAIVNLDTGGSEQSIDATVGAVQGEGMAAGAASDVGAEIASGLVDNDTVSGLFAIEERDDAAAVRGEVEKGDLVAALIIPKGFTDSINAGDPVELEVLKDPGSELSANIWESIVRSLATDISRISIIAQTAGQTAGQAGLPPQLMGAAVGAAVEAATAVDSEHPISVKQTSQATAADSNVAGMDFFAVSMTCMFLVFGAMFGAFSFITERREQTLMRLLATPTARAAVVGGKMLGIWVLGFVQFVVLYLFTSLAFGVKWGNAPVGTFAVAASMLVAVTGLAVLIASLAKTERGAGGLGSLIVQLMALIGGVFFPISILPEWLQPIRYLSIMGWGMEGLQDIQLHGATLSGVLLPIAALLGMGALFFVFGIWRLRME